MHRDADPRHRLTAHPEAIHATAPAESYRSFNFIWKYAIIRTGASLTPFFCLSLTFYNSLSGEAAGFLFFCPRAAHTHKTYASCDFVIDFPKGIVHSSPPSPRCGALAPRKDEPLSTAGGGSFDRGEVNRDRADADEPLSTAGGGSIERGEIIRKGAVSTVWNGDH